MKELTKKFFEWVGKEKVSEYLKRKGFKSVFRFNKELFERNEENIDPYNKLILKHLTHGFVDNVGEIFFVPFSEGDLKLAYNEIVEDYGISKFVGEIDLRGFSQNVNKGSKRNNPTFKKGFILKK